MTLGEGARVINSPSETLASSAQRDRIVKFRICIEKRQSVAKELPQSKSRWWLLWKTLIFL
jgi:hypothetical protein